jgi:hypothetical protein
MNEQKTGHTTMDGRFSLSPHQRKVFTSRVRITGWDYFHLIKEDNRLILTKEIKEETQKPQNITLI